MTIKTSAAGTSPSKAPKTRIEAERAAQQAISEGADATADDGRDLSHGEGGTIDLPTKPGDMSKDD